jgi:hypothetical protein
MKLPAVHYHRSVVTCTASFLRLKQFSHPPKSLCWLHDASGSLESDPVNDSDNDCFTAPV